MRCLIWLVMLMTMVSCGSTKRMKKTLTSEHTSDTLTMVDVAKVDGYHAISEKFGISEQVVVVVERLDGDSLKVETKTTTTKVINSVRMVRDTVTICVKDTVWRTHERTEEKVTDKIREKKSGTEDLIVGGVAALLLALLLIVRRYYKWN